MLVCGYNDLQCIITFCPWADQAPITQSVASPIADPGVVSLIPPGSYTFVEIDHIFYGHSPPAADSRRAAVSYKQKYVHEVLTD